MWHQTDLLFSDLTQQQWVCTVTGPLEPEEKTYDWRFHKAASMTKLRRRQLPGWRGNRGKVREPWLWASSYLVLRPACLTLQFFFGLDQADLQMKCFCILSINSVEGTDLLLFLKASEEVQKFKEGKAK